MAASQLLCQYSSSSLMLWPELRTLVYYYCCCCFVIIIIPNAAYLTVTPSSGTIQGRTG